MERVLAAELINCFGEGVSFTGQYIALSLREGLEHRTRSEFLFPFLFLR